MILVTKTSDQTRRACVCVVIPMILVTKTSDQTRRACVCVVIPFILDVRFVDVPAGVTQKEGHT